jgi:hypothetical protein
MVSVEYRRRSLRDFGPRLDLRSASIEHRRRSLRDFGPRLDLRSASISVPELS